MLVAHGPVSTSQNKKETYLWSGAEVVEIVESMDVSQVLGGVEGFTQQQSEDNTPLLPTEGENIHNVQRGS